MIPMMTNEGKKGKDTETEYPYKEFGSRMDYAMFIRNFSNKELAALMHLSRSTISGYRTGRRSPSVNELTRIASFLCVSADYLLGLQDYPDRKQAGA
jgi:transcriptional regulator with XRE-family HTH domain